MASTEKREGRIDSVSDEKENGTPRNIDEKEKQKKSEKRKDPLKDPAERQQIAKLQARDAQVRAHEAAHIAAGSGVVAGGASFTYQRGPDGRMYAIGGEVPISVQGSDNPKESIRKMRQVVAAALAPADPSPQDYAVAAGARSQEMKALQQLRKEQQEQQLQHGRDAYGQKSDRGEKEGSSVDMKA